MGVGMTANQVKKLSEVLSIEGYVLPPKDRRKWAEDLRVLAKALKHSILLDPDRLVQAEKELERVEWVIRQANTGIKRKKRDMHDWLAQVLQVAVSYDVFRPPLKKVNRD